MPDRVTVFACWDRARQEHPVDLVKRRARFTELLVQEGKAERGKPRSLPCGYPPESAKPSETS